MRRQFQPIPEHLSALLALCFQSGRYCPQHPEILSRLLGP
jgi:hypothetical protein